MNALKGCNPVAKSRLGIKTMRTKAITDAMQNLLAMLQHQINRSLCQPGTKLRRCPPLSATANGQPHNPVNKLAISNAKHRLQN